MILFDGQTTSSLKVGFAGHAQWSAHRRLRVNVRTAPAMLELTALQSVLHDDVRALTCGIARRCGTVPLHKGQERLFGRLGITPGVTRSAQARR
jgi:hypothetical protein